MIKKNNDWIRRIYSVTYKKGKELETIRFPARDLKDARLKGLDLVRKETGKFNPQIMSWGEVR